MADLTITHRFLGAACVETNIKFSRSGSPLFTAAEARHKELLAKHFNAAAIADLPAVASYAALRGKEAGFHAALPDIETNAQTMTVQLKGKKLAEALSEVEQKKNAQKMFQRQLGQSESAARAAIVEHFASVSLPAIRAERDASEQAARERLQKAVGQILDELAILDQVGTGFNEGIKSRIAPQVEAMLVTAQAARSTKE